MKWLHRILLKFRFYQRFIKWSKTFVLRGFYPLSLYHLMAFFAREIDQLTMFNRAASLSFNFMLAFFPGTIFLFTLIPYIPIRNFQGKLLTLTSTILPYNAYMAFQTTINDITSSVSQILPDGNALMNNEVRSLRAILSCGIWRLPEQSFRQKFIQKPVALKNR